jgi:hypothetical protein
VEVHKPNMTLVQETTVEGQKVIRSLAKLLKESDVMALGDVGKSGVILLGWKKSVSLLSCDIDLGIWTEFMFKDLDQEISMLWPL